MANLELLISLLKYIAADESIATVGDFYETSHPLVNAAIFMANDCLICEDGHINRTNIDAVTTAGFQVHPGEMDRFGWLTGVIKLPRGAILFG